MKVLPIIFLLLFLQNCSFDNKSGIWTNENTTKENNNTFNDYKILSESDNSFDKVIDIDKNFKFKDYKTIKNKEWSDIFYSQSNNIENFFYNETKNTLLRTKKISNYKIDPKILMVKNDIIMSDEKGNIIVFSTEKKRIISKFNFYKKKYKEIKKRLNLSTKKNIIYTSDNLGYLYAYNYVTNRLVWAKNFKIPFRSNLKIFDGKLIAANQNNILYFLDIKNGDIIKIVPTEETIIKNFFINNLSINNEYSFFLNTYGSLYGIDHTTMRPNWFINLNQSLDINPSNLFKGQALISNEKYVVASSNNFTYVININSGAVLYKKNFSQSLKPFIFDNFLFSVTHKNFLISMDLSNGKIIYSYNLENQLAKFLDSKKRKINIKHMSLVNNKILIFLNNSYVIKLRLSGEIEEIYKFKNKIYSSPIFVDGSMIYINKSNKITIIN